jgi:hypothetical protein
LLDIVVVVSLADLVCCMMLMWFCILAFSYSNWRPW